MESDFSIRNELDSVVRGTNHDADAYKGENPFSKLVDSIGSNKENASQVTPTNFGSNDGWRAQAEFASAVAKQQADVAHRAIDLMHRQFFGATENTNYWKYVAWASLGIIAVIVIIYWKSNVKLRLVSEVNSSISE